MADDESSTQSESDALASPRVGAAWGDQPASSFFKGRHWLLVLTFFMVVNIIDVMTSNGRQIEIQMTASALNGMAQNVEWNAPEGVSDFGEFIIDREITDSELLTALNQSSVGTAGIDGLLRAARSMPGVAPITDELQQRFDDARNPTIFRQIVDVFRTHVWTIDVAVPLLLGIVFVWLFFRLRRNDVRRAHGKCLSCGYDLRSNTRPNCPECAKPIRRRTAAPQKLEGTTSLRAVESSRQDPI